MAPLVIGGGIILVAGAPAGTARTTTAVYASTGAMLFTTSALYHRGRWSGRTSGVLRRVDHSNVYLLIAGTYTPIAALGLPDPDRSRVLWAIWVGAALGVTFRCTWPDAPRALYTVLYIALGWALMPVILVLLHHAGLAVFAATLSGGVCYSVGGIVYALKRPDPWPRSFGFHEVFHALTIAGWAAQYTAITLLVGHLRRALV